MNGRCLRNRDSVSQSVISRSLPALTPPARSLAPPLPVEHKYRVLAPGGLLNCDFEWLCRSESLAKSVVYVFRSHAQVRVAAPRAPAQPLAVQEVVRPSSARSPG